MHLIVLAFMYLIALRFMHLIALGFMHLIVLAFMHLIALRFMHLIVLAFMHLIALRFMHLVVLAFMHLIALAYMHLLALRFMLLIALAFMHLIACVYALDCTRISALDCTRIYALAFMRFSKSGGRSAVCNLPRVVGRCRAAFPRWYFNRATGRCQRFIFGGCGGNANNFKTKAQCERTCRNSRCKSYERELRISFHEPQNCETGSYSPGIMNYYVFCYDFVLS